MYVCVYINIYIYKCIYTYEYTYIYTYVCTQGYPELADDGGPDEVVDGAAREEVVHSSHTKCF